MEIQRKENYKSPIISTGFKLGRICGLKRSVIIGTGTLRTRLLNSQTVKSQKLPP